MSLNKSEFQTQFGWDDSFENSLLPTEHQGLLPARVIGEEKSLYRLQLSMSEVRLGFVSGKSKHDARSRVDFPAVGDWVLYEPSGDSERVLIRSICKRKNSIERQRGEDHQIVACNVDWMFIATSMNADLNINRLDRYLTIARHSGVTPVLVLTKSDLASNKEHAIQLQLEQRFPGVSIHAISIKNPGTLEPIKMRLKTGTTSVIVGSSGVGKSSLINFLLGEEASKTQEVREDDQKGRHTTTSRSMFLCRTGGLLIDTPGMRSLEATDEEGVQSHFDDIEALILQCKFTSCGHQNDPGCRIREALTSGEVTQDRWSSYQKLLSEIRLKQRKQDQTKLRGRR